MQGPWLGESRGYLADWITQRWVALTGRRVNEENCPWLVGPVGSPRGIGRDFYEHLAEAEGLRLEETPGSGLMPSFGSLAGPGFDPRDVAPQIVRFYEATSDYRLDAWSEWRGAFRFFGGLLALVFSRRLQQLNVPLAPLDTSRGLTSRVIRLVDPGSGEIRHVGWVREIPSMDRVVYVGDYSTW